MGDGITQCFMGGTCLNRSRAVCLLQLGIGGELTREGAGLPGSDEPFYSGVISDACDAFRGGPVHEAVVFLSTEKGAEWGAGLPEVRAFR